MVEHRIFHKTAFSPIQHCRVRNTTLQEREQYHQAAYFKKADEGYPCPPKQKYEQLKLLHLEISYS